MAARHGRLKLPSVALGICIGLMGLQAQASDTSPAQTAPAALTATLQRFDVDGNTLLAEPSITAALGDAAAIRTLADMQAAAQRLQDAYRAAGYGAVVVVLPEQNLQDGVLRLQVVEGKLNQINITGHNRYSRDNILHSLPALQVGQTPSLLELERQLRMANDNPGKRAHVVFQPGFKQGTVDTLVTVNERELHPWLFTLDNTGNSGTGHARASLLYLQPNVADEDIVWGLRAMTSPSHPDRVASLGSSLRVPLYLQNMIFEATFLASNSQSENLTPAGELRFSGAGTSLGGRAIWLLPSLVEHKSQLALGVDAREYRSKCSLGAWGAAGCGVTANNRLLALPLTLSYSVYKPGSSYFGADWVHNLPWGKAGSQTDYTNSRPGADPNYQLLRLNAQWLARPGEHWQLEWRANAQLTADALVAAEQFGLGGAHSVRGYAERELSGDSGIGTTLELSTPLARFANDETNPAPGNTPDAPSALWPSLGIFVDAGYVTNRLATACQPGRGKHCDIWSAGLGLNWAWNQRGAFRLDAARAGKSLVDTRRGDWKAHLSFSYAW